ncbi:ring-hydroxylating dioxygenase [Candidatus Acidianus copahuensis]|uniref:Ring-hydroxylating dioxygenase n=1 Tax=Candidatus Acidianus copahuensis TaxID=1160895 RepID=A0A031LWX1_9CREN|nr:aromatic ring-hydroxylating dioxygenase subunit alpha [Candidatus Acidianus copahuensis]EZQ12270.1 ring-hydroxylating dioxygenase [Candidatus Acidianus copahuensis]
MDEWLAIAFSDQLKEGDFRGVEVLGKEILIGRSREIFALDNRCPHRGGKLSSGRMKDARIVCPYHGWEYDINGRLSIIPSTRLKPPGISLRRYEIKESLGIIWIKIGNPIYDVSSFFPEYTNSNFRKISCGPYIFKNSAPRVVENLIDVSHFPYVHSGLLGDLRFTEVPDYDVQLGKEGVIADNIKVWQPNPDGLIQGKWVTYKYKVPRPFLVYFSKNDSSKIFSMFFSVTPISEDESLVLAFIAMNYAYDVPEEKIRGFEDEVMKQDMKVLEDEEPKYLPLDLKKEIHCPADKASIYYRTWLKELGIDCCVK